jgi:hypothetical protein
MAPIITSIESIINPVTNASSPINTSEAITELLTFYFIVLGDSEFEAIIVFH